MDELLLCTHGAQIYFVDEYRRVKSVSQPGNLSLVRVTHPSSRQELQLQVCGWEFTLTPDTPTTLSNNFYMFTNRFAPNRVQTVGVTLSSMVRHMHREIFNYHFTQMTRFNHQRGAPRYQTVITIIHGSPARVNQRGMTGLDFLSDIARGAAQGNNLGFHDIWSALVEASQNILDSLKYNTVSIVEHGFEAVEAVCHAVDIAEDIFDCRRLKPKRLLKHAALAGLKAILDDPKDRRRYY